MKILKVEENFVIEAKIIESKLFQGILPSITEGWRFNFRKYSKVKNYKTFVLIAEDDPNDIQGCLIFEMKDTIEPYMAFIEIAPHNKGNHKRYESVAGCLIAFACRLSFIHGKGDYQEWLALKVLEEKEENQRKLMTLYSQKYRAKRFMETTMVISPEDGEQLINEYLNRKDYEIKRS